MSFRGASVRTRLIYAIRMILTACCLLVLLPVSVRAASNSYSSPVYGFDILWESKWSANEGIFEGANAEFDGVALSWGAGIATTYVGFISEAATLEGIASDYLVKYLSLDGIVNILETAREMPGGSLTPTVVLFPGGSNGVGTLLAIYPYELPILGTAFVEAWMFPENVNTAELDRAYEHISFQLPQTAAEQGTYPRPSTNAGAQSAASEECAGYEGWRSSIISIHDQMVVAIEDLRASTSLPGLWFQAALNSANIAVSNLTDEMLTLEELPIGLDAISFLSLALSNYGGALRNLDFQISGTMPHNPQLIQDQMAIGDQNALAFVSEILRLDSECGI